MSTKESTNKTSSSSTAKTAETSSNKQVNNTKYKGRLVIVTGDKGGTGKSVVARMLLDIYRHRNINCLAYECDQSNPQLFRHYNKIPPGVVALKLDERNGADAIQDNLKEFKPSVSLVDLPAGAADYFEKMSEDIFLFEGLERFGYKITTISVLGRVKDSVLQLKRLVEFCGDRVDYIVLKNLYWGKPENFTRYDNSKIRQTVLQKGGIELSFPELFEDIFDVIDDKDLTFRETLENDVLTVSNQSRLFGWINKAEAEFEKAAEFLALK